MICQSGGTLTLRFTVPGKNQRQILDLIGLMKNMPTI